MKNVFSGLRVLEVGSFVAGPAAATILSDFGADVIKVETPGNGDPWRYQSGRPELPASDENYLWLMTGRNKRSIELNLKDPKGREVLERLIRESDVFLTNMIAPVREKIGIDFESVKRVNERIIYAAVSGFGSQGDERNDPAFDTTAFWGRSGLMYQIQSSAEGPPRFPPAMGDQATGLALFGGIAAALFRRAVTGEGANVEVSLLGSGAWANAFFLQAALCNARYVPVATRLNNTNPLNNHYPCKGGGWINFTMVMQQQDKYWKEFTEDIACPELFTDERFSSVAQRQAHPRELIALLDGAFQKRTSSEWKERLKGRGYVIDVIPHPDDVVKDPQMRLNGIIVPMSGAPGTSATISSPFSISGEDKEPAARAPELGEHTDEILAQLGLSASEINALRESGTIGRSAQAASPSFREHRNEQ
jgi:crotonobetainyl-CoA:carnitine CoA-transferase CaiB-like acyl-CoA transferase